MALRSTEARHPNSVQLHTQPATRVLSMLLDAQIGALGALRPALSSIDQAAGLGADALRRGGRVAYAGAGSSGLMALADCLELAGTFGLPPERTPMLFAGGAEALLHLRGSVEDDASLAQDDVDRIALGEDDVLVVVSASGTTPYALATAEAAKARGAAIIGIANVPGSLLLAVADAPVLLDTGPELVSGSTRMGAASAQKVALNMMSVMIAVRLGHVHDGHMVNLIADNAKLIARAARIVADIADVPETIAKAALAATGGVVKLAILVARGMGPDQARAALSETGGHLAPLVE
ncbi:N-acetylmuramic acid 6-phosphate etherase [Paracoccus sediminicola]|uniref:N-acetylmuramic acid 6-phosphate etherase n=1 Tax=Paracoccus sediminicola TaxID=3017783 RepID=UPI0022F06018|nr:N-acetylmuramic acid 6-phosphate etherase [Paracoccus sediminicola]WBU56637.1 N-acetylmuramic acid 6-phosphate etherase [Paracoccus sediminicola]